MVFNKIAVIAGVGVREYYRSRGYTIDSEEGCYQIKMLKKIKYIIFHKQNYSNCFIGLKCWIIFSIHIIK
jgi:hypothetical protein